MSSILVQTKLSAQHAGKASPLYKLISAKTRKRMQNPPDASDWDIAWNAAWWGLHHSTVFASFGKTLQREALLACNRVVMNEAYFIEKSGLAYTAKMMLLAESTDIAQLYALISADEATHLAWIEPFVTPEDKIQPRGQFLAFLSELIEECHPQLLVYLVQVILEGWGLDHYKRLMEGCQEPALKETFRTILKDEALHHRSGVMLLNSKRFSGDDHKILTTSLQRYADMVRVGPQAAIAALDKAVGGLSATDIKNLLAALDYSGDSNRKLRLLQHLMCQPGLENTVEALSQANYFRPLSMTQMVQYYLNHR